MKKKIIASAFVIGLAITGILGVNAREKENPSSDLTLANIEALESANSFFICEKMCVVAPDHLCRVLLTNGHEGTCTGMRNK